MEMIIKSLIVSAIVLVEAATNKSNSDKKNSQTLNGGETSKLQFVYFGILISSFIALVCYNYYKKINSTATLEVIELETIGTKVSQVVTENVDSMQTAATNVVDSLSIKIKEGANSLGQGIIPENVSEHLKSVKSAAENVVNSISEMKITDAKAVATDLSKKVTESVSDVKVSDVTVAVADLSKKVSESVSDVKVSDVTVAVADLSKKVTESVSDVKVSDVTVAVADLSKKVSEGVDSLQATATKVIDADKVKDTVVDPKLNEKVSECLKKLNSYESESNTCFSLFKNGEKTARQTLDMFNDINSKIKAEKDILKELLNMPNLDKQVKVDAKTVFSRVNKGFFKTMNEFEVLINGNIKKVADAAVDASKTKSVAAVQEAVKTLGESKIVDTLKDTLITESEPEVSAPVNEGKKGIANKFGAYISGMFNSMVKKPVDN